MKKILLLPLSVAAVLTLAGPANAGSPSSGAGASPSSTAASGWTPFVRVPSEPLDITGACSVPVHATFPLDSIVQRTRKDSGGNTEIESKGRLVVTLTPRSRPGQHYTFDISGPSLGRDSQVVYGNGDYLYRATGASLVPFFGTTVEGTGMPRLGLTQGEVAVLYTGTAKADVITRPRTVIDLCRLMHLGSA